MPDIYIYIYIAIQLNSVVLTLAHLSIAILMMSTVPTRHTHDCAFAPFSSIQQQY